MVVSVMFCSVKCFDIGSRQIRKLKLNLGCGVEKFPLDYLLSFMKALDISDGLNDLEAIYTDPKSTTIFDYDLSDTNDPETMRNMLKCAASLKKLKMDNSTSCVLILKTLSAVENLTKSKKNLGILRNFILCQGAINECNNIGIQGKDNT
jgi:hypothetical protein